MTPSVLHAPVVWFVHPAAEEKRFQQILTGFCEKSCPKKQTPPIPNSFLVLQVNLEDTWETVAPERMTFPWD